MSTLQLCLYLSALCLHGVCIVSTLCLYCVIIVSLLYLHLFPTCLLEDECVYRLGCSGVADMVSRLCLASQSVKQAHIGVGQTMAGTSDGKVQHCITAITT